MRLFLERMEHGLPLEVPFCRGMNLEIKTDAIDTLCVPKSGAHIFLPIEEKGYRVNDDFLNRQFIVLDPDGYMLRFSHNISKKK